MSDWDASRYHRISEPQFDWGQRVIARLKPSRGECILDIGCGTGRLTQELVHAVDGGRVVGLDRSGAMIAVARASATEDGSRRALYVRGDGAWLPFSGVFDAVFSAATLHWIHDHAAVFDSVFAALGRGGRFVAQCGGEGNLDRLYGRARHLMTTAAWQRFFGDWRDPWYFADADTSARRLTAAGFVEVETSLEDAPVDLKTAPLFAEFVSCVCLRHTLDRLPLGQRDAFMSEVTGEYARDPQPFVLDYRRLNIHARKAA